MEDDSEGGRRYLIATAIAQYARAPQWDRPGLVQARDEIIELFTGSLGYRHVGDLGLNPTKEQLTQLLRAFCRSPRRRPDDLIAVYIAGHGEVLDDDSLDHVLLTADTDPEDIADALPTADLARKMLLRTPVRRVLLMLDTCHSGQGGNDLAAAALTRMTRHWGDGEDLGSGLVVINSAQPAELAEVGAFPRLLREVVHGWPTAGYTSATLPLDSVVKAMNDNPTKPGFQTISSTLALLTGEVPPFLPNPRHDPRMTEVDLALQQATEWDAQAERRDTEFRTRLLVRAMGGHRPSHGWWFSGRHTALIDITSWLRSPGPARSLLAVTAAPGSGKTAVLGLIATLSNPERRATVPLHSLGLPQAAIPAADSVDVVIYAQSLTTDQVLQGIAAVAQVRAERVGELLDRLNGRSAPLTVLVDALDEAADPDQLTRRLLRPLADHANGRLRLLVGTRPHLLPNLGLRREDSVDLDAPRYADLQALTTYAARGLLEAVPDSPYRWQPPETIRAVADAVAAASNPSFLVARITSGTLAADATVPDPRDPAWRQTLPQLPGDAMRHDLETRLGDQAQRVRDLLRPLAFAEGQGLPWEDIWAPLASRIAGVIYTDEDLLWLRQHAGSYVVEATEANRSAYRLYHQALAEHLREGTEGTDATLIHRAFTDVLRSLVPLNPDGTRNWQRAHPYSLGHLATHAAHCGLLDDLIFDTGYLVHADPDGLLLALPQVTTEDGHLTCSIYRTSAGVHRRLTPADRRQVLATDAARFAAPRQHHALAAPLEWSPRWATGQQTNPALRATLTGHDNVVEAVACTVLDGQPVLVSGSQDKTVRVWDPTTGALQATFTGHGGIVYAVACTVLDGQPVVVSGSEDETVRVWDLATGALRATLAHDGWVGAVACSVLDGQPVVISGEDEMILVWDLATGALRATLDGHDDEVSAVACTVLDGQPVVISSDHRGSVRVWDLASGALWATLTGHDDSVSAVACTVLDGQLVVVSGIDDGSIWVWNPATGALWRTLACHDNLVTSVACMVLDGQPVVVSGSRDGSVGVWDLASGALRATLAGHDSFVSAVACTVLDGQPMVVSGSYDSTLRMWGLATALEKSKKSIGHTGIITDIAYSILDSQPVVVSGSGDRSVRVWDLASGALRATLDGHDGWVSAVACTVLDGQPVLVSGDRGSVRVWDLASGALRATFPGHYGRVSAVACTVLDGQPVLVIGGGDILSKDKTVRVWDLASGALRATLAVHDGEVNSVACTVLDGQPVLVSGGGGTLPVSEDKTVRVWDLTSGALRATFTGHDRGVASVACTVLDGQPVVVCSSGSKVWVWDLATGDEVARFYYDAYVGALCIGPANEIIIGTGWDLTVLDRRAR
jgi:WD40 repeat protein